MTTIEDVARGCADDFRATLRQAYAHGPDTSEADALEGALTDGITARLAEWLRPRPLDEWHDDIGNVLWWIFPIAEPPYAGAPWDDDWPGYHTHWTPIVEPPAPEPGRDAVGVSE